jgi:hypothetical protein
MWRRRPVGISVLAVVIIAVVSLAWTYFSGPSSADCAPVRELLAFNKTQIESLNSKTHEPEQGSHEKATEPSDLDYRTWSDGISDRAAKVTAPDLADQAKELAQTTDRLVRARIDLNAQSAATAPGAAPPPAALAVSGLYDQFEAELGQLSKACAG